MYVKSQYFQSLSSLFWTFVDLLDVINQFLSQIMTAGVLFMSY